MTLKKWIKLFLHSLLAKSEYTIDGIIIPIDRNSISNRISYAIANGHYERAEAAALLKLATNKDRILELGAGIGLISTIATKMTSDSNVVCVEANPNLISYIEKVHAKNGVRPKLINAVVCGASNEQEATFYIRKDFWVSSMSPTPNDYIRKVQVPLVLISDLVREYKPSVVVIDIEGGEVDLIVRDWTSGVRLVLMEIHPKVTGAGSTQKLVSYFEEKNFHIKIEYNMLLASRNIE